MKKIFQEYLYNLKAYVPGDQPKGKIIKLNTNENPFPPSQRIKKFLKNFRIESLRKYPSPSSENLRIEIAKLHKIDKDEILVTNGSDEALAILFRACLSKDSVLLVPNPTYSLYPVLKDLQMNGTKIKEIPILENHHLDFVSLKKEKANLLAFASPNAPTGILEDKKDLIDLLSCIDYPVLCDEAYIDFANPNSSMISEISKYPNLFVSRTLSKSYSLAALRVGYIISQKENIFELNKIRDSYNLGLIEQKIACLAIKDQSSLKKNVKKINSLKENLVKKLNKLGFQINSSDTNFLLAKVPKSTNANELYQFLCEKKVFVRYFNYPNLKDYIRITIGKDSDHKILLNWIKNFLEK
jgi:histidinol-phosphate aminotransferase